MRFAVEYQGVMGRVGLIIFSADNQQAAQVYVDELKTRGHERFWNLNELTEGTIGELYRLYPGIANVTVRGDVTLKGQTTE
jgi:hypothetical protein